MGILRPARAAEGYGFLPHCQDITKKPADPPCTVDDFLILAINLIDYMLAISGSLALLFFIYGGFIWLLSAGNSEKITKGKNILSAAAVGLIIVLAGWMIINLVYTTVMGTGQHGGAKVEWWKTGK